MLVCVWLRWTAPRPVVLVNDIADRNVIRYGMIPRSQRDETAGGEIELFAAAAAAATEAELQSRSFAQAKLRAVRWCRGQPHLELLETEVS